ncbi:MAG: flavin reductase family protein [Betaproteobacteria bacterium]|nr:flavin reductase family protein [Betaproteobacteria bacterium]
MFCETKDLTREALKALGLNFNPFKAVVAPRPIGWVSTINKQGVVNLAPYSFFNAVSSDPPMVFYGANGAHEADGGEKDSLRNVRETGEFVCNLVTWALRDQMNDTATPAPHGIDEMKEAGLGHLPSRLVKPPRVAASPAHLECKLHQFVELPVDPRNGKRNVMVIGQVVGIHIDDAFISNGRFDTVRAQPLARLGYMDYAVVTQAFEIKRPSWPLARKKAQADAS